MGEDLEKLKQRLPLLDYLRRQNWTAQPAGHDSEFVGLCPLHPETRPSFYVNIRKNLFYCHGCGQGGDLIRFVQLSRQLSFRQSLAHLEPQIAPADPADLLEQAAAFYQRQLPRHPEALRYLEQRGVQDPALIQELQIGYAPGGNLRRHLTAQGYSLEVLRRFGIPYYLKVDIEGHDGHVLDALVRLRAVPKYLSVESHSLDYLARLRVLGYDKFKIVNQNKNWQVKCPYPPREGKYVDFEFGGHSSGPFGEESPGEWRTFEEAAYDYLHMRFGFPDRHNLGQGWWDFHAKKEEEDVLQTGSE